MTQGRDSNGRFLPKPKPPPDPSAPPEKKTWKDGSPKAKLFTALRNGGDYTISKAAHAAGLSIRRGMELEKIRKLGEDPRLHNIARKGVESLAKGKSIGEITEIRDSTVLAACNTILDRTEPKVNRIDTRSVRVTITDTMLDKLLQLRDVPASVGSCGLLDNVTTSPNEVDNLRDTVTNTIETDTGEGRGED